MALPSTDFVARKFVGDEPDAERGVMLDDVLVNLGIRESGQPKISGRIQGFGIPTRDARERTRQEPPHRLGIVPPVAHHRPTPTCTFRNRAGLAPWPT